ncbi:hypothetical protein PN497_04955 [Sphaerospermopsis kisseleviana CS-549]|uniref:Uncharacterized protein n=3 Tax=Aphanizomenonaceae TaxID=1892259 RepID=A0A479ZVG5_9CYAN|nr:hypothetical protein [Sphaerospermopsis kisseleviana]MDB9440713.1 hypothetical protein [Sphaerospermopsis kisseleviana CS-549]BAZ78877.1 hypothetical protein NIES73_01140 [Sphaerospermopsis kisseleviana NIES-73]GCL35576.1 hypothetical protein SR1949_06720 [Sphaerospermopsis reniformis]
MLNNQSITEMTLQDLESLIDRIVDQKINQINVAKNNMEKNIVASLTTDAAISVGEEILKDFHPLVQSDGIFKDDPFFDDFVEEMAKNRRELDGEIGENDE